MTKDRRCDVTGSNDIETQDGDKDLRSDFRKSETLGEQAFVRPVAVLMIRVALVLLIMLMIMFRGMRTDALVRVDDRVQNRRGIQGTEHQQGQQRQEAEAMP